MTCLLGPVSTGRWGGTRKPDWLSGTDLTRFDVPGLCNEIWADSSGIACQDTDQMAGCILGGGTAINAALWWRPKDAAWDYNFFVDFDGHCEDAAIAPALEEIRRHAALFRVLGSFPQAVI